MYRLGLGKCPVVGDFEDQLDVFVDQSHKVRGCSSHVPSPVAHNPRVASGSKSLELTL